MLPCSSLSILIACANGIPGRKPEIRMTGSVFGALKGVGRNVGLWKVGHRIVARFEEQKNVFAIGDPGSAEAYSHAQAQRFDV